jgi:hypothetical protein
VPCPPVVTTPRTVGGPPRARSTQRVAVLRLGRPEVDQLELVGCSTGKSPDPGRCSLFPAPSPIPPSAQLFSRLCSVAAGQADNGNLGGDIMRDSSVFLRGVRALPSPKPGPDDGAGSKDVPAR